MLSTWSIIFSSILLGFTMKVADLCDEHGMRWFSGDALLFGILWGLFGVVLTLHTVEVANALVAMILGFLVRMRIDYRNHALAAALIIICFLWKSFFLPWLFFPFFIIFVVFGTLRDFSHQIAMKGCWTHTLLETSGWFYVILPSFIYGFLAKRWDIFLVFSLFVISYDATKYVLFRLKQYSQL